MKLMNSLTVRGKLILAFSLVVALMAVLGTFAVLQLSRVYGQAESILDFRLAGVRDSLKMAEAASRYRSREYRLLVSKEEDREATTKRMEAGKAAWEAARKSYAEAIADDQERKLYDAAVASWMAYTERSARILTMLQAGKSEEAHQFVSGQEGTHRFDEALAAIQKLSEYNDEQAKADAAVAKQMYEHGRTGVIVTLALAVGAAIGLGALIARAISRPLKRAVDLAEGVAAGDLTHAPTADGRDEVAQLTRALGHMVTRLRGLVGEVRGGIESVSTASTQIATGNVDLSQRTEEQASNLQQTAASMEQLTSTVKQNADNARAAAQLTAGATEVAAQGGAAVNEVISTMQEITDSSRRMADIISVIDGIAFQTNILALNAAVEAARAGEQGRGFAVVAGEVRNLAQRSAQAAKEIKGLIQHSVEKVDTGAKLVGDAGRTMNEVMQQVRRVNDLVAEISQASVEQARGIEQVGEAVSQLDQVTQQNAALVEESAAAADSMQQQAVRLAQTVSVFNLGGAAAAPAVATPRPSALARSAGTAPSRPLTKAPSAVASAPTAAANENWEAF